MSRNLEGKDSKDNFLVLGLALRPGQAKILKAAPPQGMLAQSEAVHLLRLLTKGEFCSSLAPIE